MTDDWGEWEVVRRQVAVCGRMSPTLVETVEVRATGARSTTTGSVRPDGIYFCLDLPPGDYFVAAVSRLQGTRDAGEWQNPDVLLQLEARAERLTLSEGQSRTVTLRLIER